MEIAVTCESASVTDDQVAFIVQACSQQAEEFCGAHGLPVVPVAFYAKGTKLPGSTTHALVIVDDVGDPGALGFHTDDGVIHALVLAQSPEDTAVTTSHEVLEMILDPTCDRWSPWTGGKQQATEAADRVEGDRYDEPTTILGETRAVPVSNYLLPSAFVADSQGPWDRMGRLTSWNGMTPGGYVIVQDADGNVSNVFAERGKVPGSFARKLSNPGSRTLRRLRNPVRPKVTSPEGQPA